MAMKSINDTMGPNGLIPTVFILGVLPTFPGPTRTNLIQKEILEALKLARAEM